MILLLKNFQIQYAGSSFPPLHQACHPLHILTWGSPSSGTPVFTSSVRETKLLSDLHFFMNYRKGTQSIRSRLGSDVWGPRSLSLWDTKGFPVYCVKLHVLTEMTSQFNKQRSSPSHYTTEKRVRNTLVHSVSENNSKLHANIMCTPFLATSGHRIKGPGPEILKTIPELLCRLLHPVMFPWPSR